MDTIRIDGLTLECIIGVRPAERRRRQLVRVDLKMHLDLSQAGQSGRIAQTVDYSQVTDEVRALLAFRDYQLLEVAAEETCAMLLGTHPTLEEVEISIHKPAALKGRAQSGGVEMRRARRSARTKIARGFGEIEPLLETHEAELRLLHVTPGAELPGDERRVIEWAVTGHVQGSGGVLPTHEPVAFPTGRNFAYRNVGNATATIFSCLYRPSK